MNAPENSKTKKLSSVSQGSLSSATTEILRVDADVLNSMIAEAAYYRAEARGFATGYEIEDWLEAEAEVVRSFQPA